MKRAAETTDNRQSKMTKYIDPNQLDAILERYVDNTIPKEIYIAYYPQELRSDMMFLTMNKLKNRPLYWQMIHNIVESKVIPAEDKFANFINLMTDQDLAYIGW